MYIFFSGQGSLLSLDPQRSPVTPTILMVAAVHLKFTVLRVRTKILLWRLLFFSLYTAFSLVFADKRGLRKLT